MEGKVRQGCSKARCSAGSGGGMTVQEALHLKPCAQLSEGVGEKRQSTCNPVIQLGVVEG